MASLCFSPELPPEQEEEEETLLCKGSEIRWCSTLATNRATPAGATMEAGSEKGSNSDHDSRSVSFDGRGHGPEHQLP